LGGPWVVEKRDWRGCGGGGRQSCVGRPAPSPSPLPAPDASHTPGRRSPLGLRRRRARPYLSSSSEVVFGVALGQRRRWRLEAPGTAEDGLRDGCTGWILFRNLAASSSSLYLQHSAFQLPTDFF
jgi:hypothetical protein